MEQRRFRIVKVDLEQGFVTVQYYTDKENVTQILNIGIPIQENGDFCTKEDLIKVIEGAYPEDDLEFEEKKQRAVEERKDLLELQDLIHEFIPIVEEENKPEEPDEIEVKSLWESPYGTEEHVEYTRHIILETLSDIGLIK